MSLTTDTSRTATVTGGSQLSSTTRPNVVRRTARVEHRPRQGVDRLVVAGQQRRVLQPERTDLVARLAVAQRVVVG